jgi:hypothetical protein
MLKVGDSVMWRGAWGTQPAKKVKITGIEICKEGDKCGRQVDEVSWDKVDSRRIVLDLDNGHWSYGTQISKIK